MIKVSLFCVLMLFSISSKALIITGDLPTIEGGTGTVNSGIDGVLYRVVEQTNMMLPRRLDYATILKNAEYIGNKTLIYNYVLVGFNRKNEPRFKIENLKSFKQEKEFFYCSIMEKTFFGDIGVDVVYRYHTEDMDETFTLYFYSEDCYK